MCNRHKSDVRVVITRKNDQYLDGHNFLMLLHSQLSFEDIIALVFLFNVLKGQFDQIIGSAVIDFVMTQLIAINNQTLDDI